MEYFRHLRSRIPFPVMQEYCAQRDLPSAQGWEKLQAKLEELSNNTVEQRDAVSQSLSAIFRETISVGSRAVQVYKIEPGAIGEIYDCLTALQVEDSEYSRIYPEPLSSQCLAAVPNGVFLCDIDVQRDGANLVFCTKRLIEERDFRSRDQVGNAAINEFGWQEYDEFVLIKKKFVQCYEIVRVDRDRSLIELRVENNVGADVGIALNELQCKVNEALANRFSLERQLVNPINFFPAIHPLYSNQTEGWVVELGFTTRTGSAKHEKMRARGGDLRHELFHVGGRNAIHGALTPFRIAVRWPSDGQRGAEEALLPGSIRQLSNGTPYLGHVEFKGALSEQRMQACIERIVRHLPNENA